MTAARGLRRVSVAVVAAVACMAVVAPLSAHPASTTTVAIAIERGNVVTVTIVADAEPLMAKLAALRPAASSARTEAMTANGAVARLTSLGDVLREQICLDVDAITTPLLLIDVAVNDAGKAALVFRSPLPANARAITWHSTFVYGSYPVAFKRADGTETVVWLQGSEATPPLATSGIGGHLSPARGVWMGFTHILPHGLDHILFVTGLFLLSTRARQVLAQVSAFTFAHSITLGLSLYGVFSLPAKVVEPLIALSVAYVGVENLLTSRLQPWRVLIVFGFGLLHGLGFAEALAGLRLSRADLLSTLISFNVGVEAGQLTVIAVAASVLVLATRARRGLHRPLIQFASAAIGLAGLVWMVQRMT